MFNYAAFCKALNVYFVNFNIIKLLYNQQSISKQNLNNNTCIVEQEIFKLFMNQIPSLKSLSLWKFPWINILTNYPKAKYCLKNLSELHCNSNVHSDLFYQLSQICHNLLSFFIELDDDITSDGLIEFISVQKKLRYLLVLAHCCFL